ncbi:GIY-YIG nuclease family protein [Ferruginibacter sp.]|nr:GIY-YIG nuclease family protein [Ferruginibacter sp.]
MFYVYIIRSEKDGSFYKGFSLQPLTRLQQHNNKESKYTAAKIPWQLFHIEIFDNKTTALKREIVLKKYSHQQIVALSKSFKNQLQHDIKYQGLGCSPVIPNWLGTG